MVRACPGHRVVFLTKIGSLRNQNGGLRSQFFKTNFFRIAGTSEAETSVSGKAECLLAIGKD